MRPFDRRTFIASLGGATAVSLIGHAARAAAPAPAPGRDYQLVDPPQPTTDPARVVVTEYFSYMCPHCASFAPTFSAWTKTQPADVRVERVAISLGHARWEPASSWWPTICFSIGRMLPWPGLSPRLSVLRAGA